MSVSKEQLETLKQKVIEAFADVPYPICIIGHECEECFELEEIFSGKNWKTIDSVIIEENFSNLSLFSSEAFHYFLTAYLLYSLNNFNDNFVCEFTIYALTPNLEKYGGSIQDWQYKFKNFNIEQMDLIYEFLDIVKAKTDDNFDLFHKGIEAGKKNLKEFIEPMVGK